MPGDSASAEMNIFINGMGKCALFSLALTVMILDKPLHLRKRAISIDYKDTPFFGTVRK